MRLHDTFNIQTIYYGGSEEIWNQKLEEYEYGNHFNDTTLVANHTHVIDPASIGTAPTCDRDGYLGGHTCKLCKTVLVPKTAAACYGHVPGTQVLGKAATTTTDGYTTSSICKVCGKNVGKTTLYKVSNIKLSTTNYTYSGAVKTPSVTVKNSKGVALVKNTDYTITYASGRKSIGKYSVKIAFKGKYYGSKILYFNINPKGTTLSTATGVKGGFKVTWKKQTSQTTGYQLQYATSSKFSSAKTVTISKNSTTSKTVTKLKKGKKYYVRIRTYKTVSGTKYYSAWSKSKTVTAK